MQLKKYHQETIMLKLRMYSLHHLPSEREINRTLNTIAHKSMVAYIDCNFNIRHFLEIKTEGVLPSIFVFLLWISCVS